VLLISQDTLLPGHPLIDQTPSDLDLGRGWVIFAYLSSKTNFWVL